ncbi:AraC family transcriptional regulator [Pseudozobellia thermophila]|uniref:AraC-type DNA-binding protein n=1 Tax=Pseudozobellia thermophila TaxID=192903 RepID=A0A1M6G1I5_9FLAO|nr:AraC family transcriptional regulator [Pseudozobellia thermophila]SHJ03835.1 AraC-type DNA-binding protein [Pseudozobellia thermophila]
MKLHFLNRTSVSDRSFSINHNVYPNFLRVWHYHPEIELVVILKSTGTRFIGDSIEKFQEGEVVLIGKNVPHMWLNDEVYFQPDSTLEAEAFAVHFTRDFLGKDFFNIPEMKQISELLDRANRGIRFNGLTTAQVRRIIDLIDCDFTTRVYRIIEVLHDLAKHGEYDLLASTSFLSSFQKTGNSRMDKIYAYVFENFNSGISASDVARMSGMNKSAFSRFFKKAHRKSFTRYLNEIKVGYACKLLLENKESITSIAYLSGFNNISNFNRQFKVISGMSPSEYLKYHLSKG